MSIYQLVCESCSKELEVRLPMVSEKPTTCECGGKLRQVFHAPALFMGKAPFSFYRKFSAPHHDYKKP